jgi:hypothetical protein
LTGFWDNSREHALPQRRLLRQRHLRKNKGEKNKNHQLDNKQEKHQDRHMFPSAEHLRISRVHRCSRNTVGNDELL